MNNSFEVHTENLNGNLESVERYMGRFKESIKGDLDKAFDSTFESINNVLPFKDLISESLTKNKPKEQSNYGYSDLKEIEITIEMNSNPLFVTDLQNELSKATELIKSSSENAYAETRIHIYSLFTYIIVIFEDYLKKVLNKEETFNDLLTIVSDTFKSNNINANKWYRNIKRFQRIRNLIVHKNGERNPGQYLLLTVNDDLMPLISTINEFVEKYRYLLKRVNNK
ncbi:hypothetical protein P4H66_27935 [Paenibacillus dokdonensis]|uniref:RiboL-PSP-HEPN domain-containing protein n=1 Tax=Paenibacillus dokdonensis TaxID=2567944 RepID=A0ABU6GV77_9BACL|nr:hypothetical protein [Paenibacillus dokdonensis]MEC0243646.1 hypothetical protein [Paenibacillus dokdonensis]